MLKAMLSVGDLSLDMSKLEKTLKRQARAAMKETARAFLLETRKHVPVYSGESMATLLRLAEYLHVVMNITPDPAAREDRVLYGRAMGAVANQKIPVYRRKGVWTFEYRMPRGLHYNVNELMDATKFGFHLRKPGPYYSYQKGNTAAYVEYQKQIAAITIPKYIDLAVLKNRVDY